ncbi:hypothetical protein D3C71_1339590 [compost metagenome]
MALHAQGHVDQGNQHGHFNQGAYHTGEGLIRAQPEHGDGDRNGQLEVIAGRSKGDGGVLVIGNAQLLAHQEAGEEHQHKVDHQGHGDPQHIHGQLDYHLPLEAEHQHYGGQQGDQSDG